MRFGGKKGERILIGLELSGSRMKLEIRVEMLVLEKKDIFLSDNEREE